MVAMEKISLKPLIEEFSLNSALYNQWNNESTMKYGNLPAEIISSWMVEVVEPVVKSAVGLNSAPEKVHELVKPLYLESLKLIGSGLAISYKNEYKSVWLLMAKNPNLLLKFPVKTISLLNDVILKLRTYVPEKIVEWCGLMEATSAEIKTIEDFKIVGRMYAWKCGLAHLRTRLKDDFDLLSDNLQEKIINTLSIDKNTSQFFEKPWVNSGTKYQGVEGGFEGTTGFFEHPPKLALIDDLILVTDTESCYVLFADQFGKILLPANMMNAVNILENSENASLQKWARDENLKIPTSKVSSAVITKNTLVFTLKDSYFLYLYSLSNA